MCDLLDSGSWLTLRDGYNKGAGMGLPVKGLSRASETWDMRQVSRCVCVVVSGI